MSDEARARELRPAVDAWVQRLASDERLEALIDRCAEVEARLERLGSTAQAMQTLARLGLPARVMSQNVLGGESNTETVQRVVLVVDGECIDEGEGTVSISPVR